VNDLLTLKRRGLAWAPVRRARAARELARLVRVLARSALFDRELYELQRERRFRSSAAAAYDFVVVGSRAGLVAGPLLLPPVPATDRARGPVAAAWWASQVRAAGFPRTTAHPLADLRWYAGAVAGSDSWRGGPLAHYTERGRFEGARLGPLDPGVDLVERGRAAVRAPRRTPEPAAPTLADPVTAVVVGHDAREVLAAVRVLMDPASGVDRIVVVTPPGGSAESRVAGDALELLAPRLQPVPDVEPARRMTELVTTATSEVVVVVTRPVEVTGSTLRALVALVRAGADIAQPVVLGADDTVLAAGMDEGGHGRLRGWPLADAERAGDVAIPTVSGELVALRPAALASLVGVGTRADATEQLRELSSVAAADDRGVVVSGGVHVRAVPARQPGPADRPGPYTGRTAYADPSAPGVLRWAIKSAHPAGAGRAAWGDFHVARALAAELEALGHHAAVDPRQSWYRETASADHVVLSLRGLHRYRPSPHQISLLWVLSHPELVTRDELGDYDVVLAASRPWAQRMSDSGIPVLAMLQCTDAHVFRPDVAEPGTGDPLLFVGNSRSARRPLVEEAARTRSELTVIGGGWAGRLPDGVVRADHVDNAELPALYRAAGVVLNDHWPHMAAEGFLSNRLFDLTAAGARWVSDPALDLLEVFPQGRVASDAGELARLLDGAPGTFPTEDELQEASARVRELHSFAARARTLDSLVRDLVERRRG
jgi:hypothetical protein